MSADDIRLGRRNHALDIWNAWVDRRRCRAGWHFLTQIGDLKPITLNQRFLNQVSAMVRSSTVVWSVIGAAGVLAILPIPIAPSTTKHKAASQTVLIISRSRRQIRHNSL
jgi:hypothetical protein